MRLSSESGEEAAVYCQQSPDRGSVVRVNSDAGNARGVHSAVSFDAT